jgi:glucose dehydrogenase
MSKLMPRPNLTNLAVLIATALTCVVVLQANGQLPATTKKELAKEMIGTWALAGTPDNIEKPADGARLKFLSGRHWAITQYDPKTGKVIFHHGGTYSLDGDTYTESVEYANENTAELIGQKLKFKVKVDGDIFTNVGQGNPWTEAWKRAK